ncbi:uncharacterized protein LOC130705665 [Balaenoptera acutorostrata]|uniref:Uncharacterized protein LOC130705665 n=1 Tax=Balaenoptera acutorostrata TaxID=9767 RepID=A0ABM3SIC3_BALAC|nr:uncharacterized protein LOC130705665 [Balaenoptera acutorostrata]
MGFVPGGVCLPPPGTQGNGACGSRAGRAQGHPSLPCRAANPKSEQLPGSGGLGKTALNPVPSSSGGVWPHTPSSSGLQSQEAQVGWWEGAPQPGARPPESVLRGDRRIVYHRGKAASSLSGPSTRGADDVPVQPSAAGDHLRCRVRPGARSCIHPVILAPSSDCPRSSRSLSPFGAKAFTTECFIHVCVDGSVIRDAVEKSGDRDGTVRTLGEQGYWNTSRLRRARCRVAVLWRPNPLQPADLQVPSCTLSSGERRGPGQARDWSPETQVRVPLPP